MITLVTGSNGQLGKTLNSITENNKQFIYLDKDELDITKENKLQEVILKYKIKSIVNCAAYTDVNRAETEKEKALEINSIAVLRLAKLAEKYNLRVIHISTDYVYGGLNKSEISEDEIINPQNYYGLSKSEGDNNIIKSKSDSIVIRTSWLYSRYGKNFVKNIIEKANDKDSINVVDDQFGCPTNAVDLAEAILKILRFKDRIDSKSKVYNFSNLGYTNWYNFAKYIIKQNKIECSVNKIKSNAINQRAKRPKFTITDKTKIISVFNIEIPHWKESLKKFLKKKS